MALLNITYKQGITSVLSTMLPWQDPLRTSVEFTGRSVALQNRGVLGEDAWGGVKGVGGRLGRIVTGA